MSTTESAKHTPGPWVAVNDDQKLPGGLTLKFVAVQAGAGNLMRLPGTEQAILDARLIAAAPELLAACQAAIEATGGSQIWNGETKRFLEMCEAAIAKATA